MPVSVAGASAATFAQHLAGARPQPVSRPTTTSEDGAATTEMRSSLLHGCAVVNDVGDRRGSAQPSRGCKDPVGHGPEA